MAVTYQTISNTAVTLDNLLGSGGEGEVWTVKNRLDVAKLYHPKIITPEHELKIRAMLANPPEDKMRRRGHVSIAWPTDGLFLNGKFVGFLMPRLERSPTIFTVYNPVKRAKETPGFTWKYLFFTALNLAIAVDAIHSKGYVIGDLNESNVLVNSRALVSIIDTDSFQVRDSQGRIFRCRVGKEDFLPPELLGVALDKADRLPEHDHFGLGVLMFRLLMEGVHPFMGIVKVDLPTMEPSQLYCQKVGAFPYDRKNSTVQPPIMAPKFETLPPPIQELMRQCFQAGHQNPAARPSAEKWVETLEKVQKDIIICKVNPDHFYSDHLRKCPWCEREAAKKQERMQVALPPASGPRSRPVNRPAALAPAPPNQLGVAAINIKPTGVKSVSSPSPGLLRINWPGLLTNAVRLPSSPSPIVKRWRHYFISAGLSLDRRIWWKGVRLQLLFGGLAGIALFALINLVFTYPGHAGNIAGVFVGLIIFSVSLMIALFLNKQTFYYLKISAILALILGAILGYVVGNQVTTITNAYLLQYHPQIVWVFIQSVEAGLFWGLALGSYRTIRLRKSPAMAVLTALVLSLIPFGIFYILTLWGLP